MKKTAFTLAEVLITLGVIGVVAAVTMPTLIQKHQEKVTVTKLKKAYSIISQAYMQAVEENGTPEYWNLIGTDSPEGAKNFYLVMSKYLKVTRACEPNDENVSCFPYIMHNLNSKTDIKVGEYNWVYRFAIADGTAMYTQVNDPNCQGYVGINPSPYDTSCGGIAVDINGSKGPNEKGRDIFYFSITKNGVFPHGIENDKIVPFETKCYTNGFSCAGWVIVNENMDYLHCDDLSWDGKHTCK